MRQGAAPIAISEDQFEQIKSTANLDHDEYEGLHRLALGVLLRADAVRECDVHDGLYFEGSADVEEVIEMAPQFLGGRNASELPTGVTMEQFAEILREVHRDNSGPTECPICERNLRD